MEFKQHWTNNTTSSVCAAAKKTKTIKRSFHLYIQSAFLGVLWSFQSSIVSSSQNQNYHYCKYEKTGQIVLIR